MFAGLSQEINEAVVKKLFIPEKVMYKNSNIWPFF